MDEYLFNSDYKTHILGLDHLTINYDFHFLKIGEEKNFSLKS